VIEQLSLRNFKAFEEFKIPLGNRSVLIGPNNAGKSTAIAALRAAAAMLRHARRFNPTGQRDLPSERVRTYEFSLGQFGVEEDNLRYEFRDVQTSITARFTGGSTLSAIWPAGQLDGFFYLKHPDRPQPRTTTEVKHLFPLLGTIPVLSPIERHEALLSEDYVAQTLSSRLASRHFRNQLALLRHGESSTHEDQLDEFLAFARLWLPEIALSRPDLRNTPTSPEYDVYYREGATSKEMVWSGDGIQVFVQLLLHAYRFRSYDSIILDEPDVYLHADLQRRLLRLLNELSPQIIFATHSAEIASESPPEAIVWMDRTRRRAVRSPDAGTLELLSDSIGSQFNLRLARLLRTKKALFVEGKDMSLLRNLAAKVGAAELVTEAKIAAVPLEGAANWRRLQGFGWIANNLLQGTIRGYALLDRDYHMQAAIRKLSNALNDEGIELHVWDRKELENYLIDPVLISRISGAPVAWVKSHLAAIGSGLRDHVLFRMMSTWREDGGDTKYSVVTIGEACSTELDLGWKDPEIRIRRCPAKEVIAAMNTRLQEAGHRTISASLLSREIYPDEVPEEMRNVLRHISSAVNK
jgi:putative AbiEii toxin of type IV toxin-antitoxin system